MPVGFSSAARNLFLLGSSGTQVVTNFFESISKASTTDGVFIPDEIRYIDTNKKYALAGSAADSNSKGFGWLERQDYNLETGNLTTDYSVRIESPQAGVNTTLRAMELDSNNNLIVAGFTGTVPWIAKYSNDGVLDWQSTTNSANVRYLGVTSDSSGNYYACGRTSLTAADTQAFVEKFDSNGNPGWGKQAFMLGRDVVLEKISANDRGEVVAVGFLEDDSADKGYIVKIDTNTGEVLWDRTLERNISGYGGGFSPDDIAPANVKCTACYIDSLDQIYVVGTIDGNSPVDNGVGEFLIKYSPEGNIIWQRERDTNHYTILDGAPNTVPFDVKSDGETEQTVVLSVENYGSFALFDADIFISKYSKNGDLVFRRKISKGNDNLGAACLDADPSFYYIMFRDQRVDALSGEPDRYTFGKVSTSGNGLGDFQYNDGTATLIDYTAVVSVDGSPPPENKIGRLSDGSVTNSVSDLMTYPFTANKLLFDDLATHVSNKKRQMDSADSFEYSGSPAIRVADFNQYINLRGDIYSGSGDWLDQSGNGKNGVISSATYNAGGYFEFTGPTSSDTRIAVDTSGYGNQDFSISMWFNQGAQTTYHMLLGAKGYGDGTESGIGHYLYQDTIITWVQEGANGAVNIWDSNGVVNFTAGVWYNLVLMREYGVAWRWYVNGTLVNTNTTQFLTTDWTSSESYIGDHYNTSVYHFDGSIGDVLIYDKILTPAQVFQNYNATKSKYINEAPDTAPKISDSPIVYDSNLLLNYDFGNRATFDSTSNEFKFSDDLTDSNWVKLASVIVQEYNDRPKGFETNATAIIRSTTAEAQLVRQVFQTPTGVPVNISCYAKSIAGGNLCINYNSGTVLFDFSTETGTAIVQYDHNGTDTSPIPSSITMEDVGNGWYRCSYTGYSNNGFAQCQFQPWTQAMSVIDATTWDDRYDAGDGEQGVAIIGTQFAEGVTTPPRYFKTSGTAITAPTTVKNLSSSSYTGTINGATFNLDKFDFDGTNDSITVAGTIPVIGTNDFAIECWIYLPNVTPTSCWRGIVTIGNGFTTTGGITLYAPRATTPANTTVAILSAVNPTIGGTSNVNNSTWHHVVLTRVSSTLDIYVDGTSEASQNNTANITQTAVTIGRDLDCGTTYYQGSIRELRIYNRGLTATEVSQNFNATRSKYGV